MSETGALSVEDAVAHLSAEEAVDDQPHDGDQDAGSNETDQTQDPEDPDHQADDGGDDQGDDPDDAPDPDGDNDPDVPAIDAPNSWDAEHKEKFAALPREMQEFLLKRETERDRGVSAAQQRASEARQRAEQEAQAVAALKPRIEALTAQAAQALDRWSGMDATAWQRAAQTMDPREFNLLRADYDADVQRAQQLDAARQQAEAVEWQAFAQTQTARLPEVAPQLADDHKALAEVFDYIAKATPTLTNEDRKWIDADQILIAWKAMKYDQASAPQPKPQGKKVVSARPSTAPAPLKQRQTAQTTERFKKTGSIADAVALLNQRG